jgi:hypothetical protein
LSRRSLRLPKMRVRMLEIIGNDRREGTASVVTFGRRAKKQGVRRSSPYLHSLELGSALEEGFDPRSYLRV